MLTIEEILADAAAAPAFHLLKDIEVNSRGVNGSTPLHWMATLGDDKAISILAKCGALLDVQDNAGNTPLHEAVITRQVPAVIELIRLGASISIPNSQGDTPADIARRDTFQPLKDLF